MFTKKPEREMSGDSPQRMSDRPSDTSPFGERPAGYVKSTSPSKLVPSIIGEDLTITGNVSSKGEIQVDGEIQGDVQCGSLLLGDKSQINGSVLAEDVVVRGRVLGSIRGLRVTLQEPRHRAGRLFRREVAPHRRSALDQGGQARRVKHAGSAPRRGIIRRSQPRTLGGPLFRVDSLGQRRLDELVDIAVEHGRWVGAFHARAQILHELIGLQHVRPDLMAETDVGFGGGGGLRCFLPAL
jgi:cytoskeletal protein CcmA (bactofilin family)